jgi:hypothetical protein
MSLSFDPERLVEDKECPQCKQNYLLVRGFLLDDGDAHVPPAESD